MHCQHVWLPTCVHVYILAIKFASSATGCVCVCVCVYVCLLEVTKQQQCMKYFICVFKHFVLLERYCFASRTELASSPGHSQILSCSRGEKSGEGLVPILRHGPEMVDSIS